MKLRPWLERNQSPGGKKRDALIGVQVTATLAEAKAFLKRLWRKVAGKDKTKPDNSD